MDEYKKKLEETLKTLRQLGYSDDDIRKGLRQFGYSDDDIRRAIENDSKKLDEEIESLEERIRLQDEKIKAYNAQISQLEKQIEAGRNVTEREKRQPQTGYKGDKDVIKMAEKLFEVIKSFAKIKGDNKGSAYLDFGVSIECRDNALAYIFDGWYLDNVYFSDYRLMPIKSEEKRIQLESDVAEMVVSRLNGAFPNLDIHIEDEYEDVYENVYETRYTYDHKGRIDKSYPVIVDKKLVGKKRVRKKIIAKDPAPLREL